MSQTHSPLQVKVTQIRHIMNTHLDEDDNSKIEGVEGAASFDQHHCTIKGIKGHADLETFTGMIKDIQSVDPMHQYWIAHLN